MILRIYLTLGEFMGSINILVGENGASMTYIVDLYSFAKKPYVPLLIVLIMLLLFVVFDGYQIFDLQYLQHKSFQIHNLVSDHWFLAPILYMVVYATCVGISAPGAFIFSILGGFMFGPFFGAFLAILSASGGALIIYEVLSHAVGNDVKNRLSPFAQEIRQGFEQHGFSYMIIMRVAPVFPFWVVNLVPALLGINRRVNAITTFFGIAPSCLVYSFVGAGAASVISRGHLLTADLLLTDSAVLLPLNALVLLLALPLIVKMWCHYKQEHSLK